ncbi:MAG: Smr/MutS family protein [Polyangiaceae bacterium]
MSASKKSNKPDPKSPFAVLRGVKEKLTKEEGSRTAGVGGAKKPVVHAHPPAPAADPEEDRLSFHRMMSGVQPIEQTKGRVPRSAQVPPSGELVPRGRGAEAEAALQEEADEVHAHLRALVEGKERFEVEDDGRRISGRRVDLPKEALRKLRRGTTPIDARIDLHGMGVAEARTAVTTFLRDTRVAGERCVLIIHGKGEHSPRAQPVLRGEIGAWLSQGGASEHVAAFVTAEGGDGGEGAVYVLLRR